MPHLTLYAPVAAFILGGLVAGAALLGGQNVRPPETNVPEAAWVEIRWPFPSDPWGKGKAFRCPASHCGTEVTVFVRPKIGFCNCATGVADDEELARIGDLDLLGSRLTAQGAGRPVKIAWMNGRSRTFAIEGGAHWSSVLSIGYNDRCDAVVATALVGGSDADAAEAKVVTFLNGRPVLGWIEVALGL